MKKLDKLILTAFLGPFFLTFVVVVFILLTQYLLKYLEDFVGKDLGFSVFAELIFYFSLNMVPVALPLAILLSSLMTFGNLGEHFELTAIKSAGISLTRALLPIGFIVILLSVVAFFFNNNIVPKANLKAYSLLYDIRQKKPALDFKEGAFYNGLPGYSIKVSKKYPDGRTLKNLMIYDHSQGKGNTDLIIADSGKMYMAYNDKYLILELFNGKNFSETQDNERPQGYTFLRNQFKKSKMVFSLESFELNRTKEELFATNKLMLNVAELQRTSDSLRNEKTNIEKSLEGNVKPYYSFHTRQDTVSRNVSKAQAIDVNDSLVKANKQQILNRAVNQARSIKAFTSTHVERMYHLTKDSNIFEIEKYRKYTQSLACIIMFLIGAPLGAIIKKGGFGIPVLISIIFFILFYVLSIMGEKWAKESLVDVPIGMWWANCMLFPVGLFFWYKARKDSRLLETDIYTPLISGVKKIFKKK